eukprot:COSAG06_NODE_3738_length_4958_cov_4.920560_5_plen_405_part_00
MCRRVAGGWRRWVDRRCMVYVLTVVQWGGSGPGQWRDGAANDGDHNTCWDATGDLIPEFVTYRSLSATPICSVIVHAESQCGWSNHMAVPWWFNLKVSSDPDFGTSQDLVTGHEVPTAQGTFCADVEPQPVCGGGDAGFCPVPPPPPEPVDCVGAYSELGDCSEPCGPDGVATRLFAVTTLASNGGVECPIAAGHIETQSCNTEIACPVDCVMDQLRTPVLISNNIAANRQAQDTCAEAPSSDFPIAMTNTLANGDTVWADTNFEAGGMHLWDGVSPATCSNYGAIDRDGAQLFDDATGTWGTMYHGVCDPNRDWLVDGARIRYSWNTNNVGLTDGMPSAGVGQTKLVTSITFEQTLTQAGVEIYPTGNIQINCELWSSDRSHQMYMYTKAVAKAAGQSHFSHH